MHPSSRENMRRFVEKYVREGTKLLDVGSREIEGQFESSYRSLFDGMNIKYMGCDMVPGENVNIVLEKPYVWKEIKPNSFDYVISGQMLEHVGFPWLTFLEIHRVLRPGGICCIIAPSAGYMHNYPLDCYRYYPDGMVALAHTAHLKVLDVYTNWSYEKFPYLDPIWKDTVLIAQKEEKKLKNFKASVKRALYHIASCKSLKSVQRISSNIEQDDDPLMQEHTVVPMDDDGNMLSSAQQRALFRHLTEGKKLNDLELFFGEREHRPIHKCLNYFGIYDEFFSRYKGKPVVMLEIGVSQGGSLQMWKDYFGPQSLIVGVDIDPKCKNLEEPGIEIFIGDQADRKFWQEFKQTVSSVDILLDDGGHTASQQYITFQEMFPHLTSEGLYLCEDLHTSYWSGFNGGYLRQGTFVEHCKGLIDSMNAWHSESDSLQPDYFTHSIQGVHFYDGIVVIEKGNRTKPPDILRI
ncbi:MAG: Mycinamicin VI 2''-O-methyltransferase [Pelotomaculum sp. PtaB.Bin104]|nr:MAG: Mycinamicin VI 2''-O-methyltransferase [Pelotomaculum sp. PtaB.Bin104]